MPEKVDSEVAGAENLTMAADGPGIWFGDSAGVLVQRNQRQVAASEVVALGAGFTTLAFF